MVVVDQGEKLQFGRFGLDVDAQSEGRQSLVFRHLATA